MKGQPIVLINTFEVSPRQEDDFLRSWERSRDFLMTQDGYRSSRLHQGVNPGADRRFVSVAAWDSEATFRAAITSNGFRELNLAYPIDASIYEVVRADERWRTGSAVLEKP